MFEQRLGRDFCGQVLSTLAGAGGYRRRHPGELVESGERNYYVYLYDWRLDNITAVAGLYELIQRVRDDYGNPRLKVDVPAPCYAARCWATAGQTPNKTATASGARPKATQCFCANSTSS